MATHLADLAIDLSEAPLDLVQRSAPALLRHPAVQLAATSTLLGRLPLEDAHGARRIAQLLSAHGSRTAARTADVLQILLIVPSATARELLGLVPQLLGDTNEEMCQFLAAVKELIAADRTLMLPAIGALGEVALPEVHKPELAQLALGALPLADESDLPTLVRCVLGALPPAQAGRTLRQLRSQLGAVSSGTLALLLQVVANTLRVNGGTARALLTQTGAASHLTRWEAMLLLLLLPMPRHAAAATQALSRALCRGALTAAELVACATDSALPATVLSRLPPLCAALLADPAVDAARHGAYLAVGLVGSTAPSSVLTGGSCGGDYVHSGAGVGTSSAASDALPGGPSATPVGASRSHAPQLDRSTGSQLALSELLSALFGAPASAAAAAVAFSVLADGHAQALAASSTMLSEALQHAPRLRPSLLPPLCACLAAVAAVQPAFRQPLLLFIQKHALGGGSGALVARQGSQRLSRLPEADADADAPLVAALQLAYALLRRRASLTTSEGSTVVRWLVQAAPMATGAGAVVAWRLLGRCVGLLTAEERATLADFTLPRLLLDQGVLLPLAPPPEPAESTERRGAPRGLFASLPDHDRTQSRQRTAPLLAGAANADEALALGRLWWELPSSGAASASLDGWRDFGTWREVLYAQMLCVLRCAELPGRVVAADGAGLSYIWRLALPASLAPLAASLGSLVSGGARSEACEGPLGNTGADGGMAEDQNTTEADASSDLVGRVRAARDGEALGRSAEAEAPPAHPPSEPFKSLELGRHALALLGVVDLGLRWEGRRPRLGKGALGSGELLVCRVAERCHLVLLVAQCVRAVSSPSTRHDAAALHFELSRALSRPLPARLCVEVLAALVVSGANATQECTTEAHKAETWAVPRAALRLHVLRELWKRFCNSSEASASTKAASATLPSAAAALAPDRTMTDRADVGIALDRTMKERADVGSRTICDAASRCGAGSSGGGGGSSSSDYCDLSSTRDAAEHVSDADGDESSDEDTLLSSSSVWRREMLHTLVDTTALLSAATDLGRRQSAQSPDQSHVPAWRADMEATAVAYHAFATCCRIDGRLASAAGDGAFAHTASAWLATLRKQLTLLPEPHLVCALLDAVVTLEGLLTREGPRTGSADVSMGAAEGAMLGAAQGVRLEGDLDEAAEAAVPPAPGSTVSPPASGTVARRMAVRALTIVYPSHVPSLATYLPSQRGGRGRGGGISRQHSALCALVRAALRSLPSDLALSGVRALAVACDELSAALKLATPRAHRAISLLTPAARPALLLELLAHISTSLQRFVPLSSAGALRRLLGYVPRATALAARALLSLRMLARAALETGGFSGFATALSATCAVLCNALRAALAAAVECRSRQGCSVTASAMATTRDVSRNLVAAMRDLIGDLKLADSTRSGEPNRGAVGGDGGVPIGKALLTASGGKAARRASGRAASAQRMPTRKSRQDDDEDDEDDEYDEDDDSGGDGGDDGNGVAQRAPKRPKAPQSVAQRAPKRRRTSGRVGGSAPERAGAKPTAGRQRGGIPFSSTASGPSLTLPRLQLKLEQLEVLLAELATTHHVPDAPDEAVAKVQAWAAAEGIKAEMELTKLGRGKGAPQPTGLPTAATSGGAAASSAPPIENGTLRTAPRAPRRVRPIRVPSAASVTTVAPVDHGVQSGVDSSDEEDDTSATAMDTASGDGGFEHEPEGEGALNGTIEVSDDGGSEDELEGSGAGEGEEDEGEEDEDEDEGEEDERGGWADGYSSASDPDEGSDAAHLAGWQARYAAGESAHPNTESAPTVAGFDGTDTIVIDFRGCAGANT